MEDERILKALRAMAWERAKGEINSMSHTYYREYDDDKFNEFIKAFDEFKEKIETNELHT